MDEEIYLDEDSTQLISGYLFEVDDIDISSSELTGANISTPLEETIYLLINNDSIHSFSITYDNMTRYYGFNEVITEVYGPPLITYNEKLETRILKDETSVSFKIQNKFPKLGKIVTRDELKCSKYHQKLICNLLLSCEDSIFESNALTYYDEEWNEIDPTPLPE